jgi:AP2 domain
MSRAVDVTGQRFGWLVAVERADVVNKNRRWRCRCDCGNFHTVQLSHLRYGTVKSCGCRRHANKAYTHGHTRKGKRHPLYSVWASMRDRCDNPHSKYYKDYGDRGIKVCERWNDFTNFLADMGERPGPKFVIDRIDNNGHYEPGNIRWATPKESNNNRRPPKRKAGCSGVQGVSRHRNRWRARLKRNGKYIYVECFATVEAARAAYREALIRLRGEAEWQRQEALF